MSSYLSFADRERLLRSLDLLAEESVETSDLLARAGEWARLLEPRFGFEHSLVKNIAHLSNYLRHHPSVRDIVNIARGALRFLTCDQCPSDHDSDSCNPSVELPEHFILSKAFVANYAVHEISLRLDHPVAYNPPAITKDEQEQAEQMFLRLAFEAADCDETLIEQVNENLKDLAGLSACGFLRRLVNNSRALIAVLRDPCRSDEHKSCARGALRYLVEDDDVIGDGFGLIGYLDDHFVVQTALDFVTPQREPLVELLDDVVATWPFLNMLSIDDGSGSRPTSEFAILNSALSCRKLRSSDANTTMLIAPETGPVAIQIGFIATLGLAQESGQREITEETFREGQKVLVDYSAVAEFAGFDTLDGRRMFKLRQYFTDRGGRGESIRYWPIADLRRIVPADPSRSIRGRISHDLSRKQDTLLPGLDYLFSGSKTSDVHAIDKQIIVVMPTTLADDFCKSVTLYGKPLRDVVPIGHICADGESVEPWSNRFGPQQPILLFASDLDVARDYAEEHRDQIELVIVDVTGRNTEKHASLKRLNRFKIPCLLVASERVADETDLDQHNDLSIWEWGPDDLAALVWPETAIAATSGEIAKFEQRIESTITSRPVIEAVSMPVVTKVYKAFLKLRRLARQRGGETLAELEDMVGIAFFALTHLMRCATPVSEDFASLSIVREQVSRIESMTQRSIFLSAEERAASAELTRLIGQLIAELCEKNPKATALLGLLERYPKATVLCADARLIPELQKTYGNRQARIVGSATATDTFDGGLIVPGWFRQSRMSAVLSPPIADPVVLLLYDVERHWHQSFILKRRTNRDDRRALSRRSEIFPKMVGWTKPVLPDSPAEVPEADSQEVEDIRAEVYNRYKKRVYDATSTNGSEADTKARCVIFVGGSYGFFTENYRLNVVTHLIDSLSDEDDENASVKAVAAKNVRIGDAVIFRPHSRDLIREVADTLLEPGMRQMSSMWRDSLRRFLEENQFSSEQLRTGLKSAGCEIGQQTMQNWLNDEYMIAPAKQTTVVPAIAKVTGDSELTAKTNQVCEAIKKVRAAHQQQAPRVLAKQVRENAADVVRQEQAEPNLIHLAGGFVLVRVAEEPTELLPANYASANQLIEGSAWLE